MQKAMVDHIDMPGAYGAKQSATILEQNLLSGRTYSTAQVVYYPDDIEGKTKKKKILLEHSHCPFCGKKYGKVEKTKRKRMRTESEMEALEDHDRRALNP